MFRGSVTPPPYRSPMVIDCDTCTAAGPACGDCVVSLLLGPPELSAEHERAVGVLAQTGLIPPLRLVRPA